MKQSFIWFDRIGCIRRAAVIQTCTRSTIEEAVKRSLETREKDGRFRFCNDPEQINARMLKQLVRDTEKYIKAPFDYIKSMRQMHQRISR